MLVNALQFIESDIYREGVAREEWATIESVQDPRVMGRWNVRCRTIAIIQALGYYREANLHPIFMAWVKRNRLEEGES